MPHLGDWFVLGVRTGHDAKLFVAWQGKVNEGTFGVVFKAIRASEKANWEDHVQRGQVYPQFFAIKKPKNNAREGEGFNKDAVREIALLMELKRGTGSFSRKFFQPLKMMCA